MLDTTDCIICGENILHYDTLITDGDWVWSADLKHYFDHHNFVFPEDFLQSIRSKNYEISEISTSFGEELCERFNFFSENDLSDFEVRRLW
ncbi:MAG: hypothetical protein JST26_17605 [Bacteroidetes bacterium]|nr:hypothetical protein [Bacteroidota bacterium]